MERENIESSIKSQGREELLKHVKGERLTLREAVVAKCFDCCCGYSDGKKDCQVPKCSLHPFMPYREGGIRKLKIVSDEQRRKAAERLRERRAKQADFCAGVKQGQCSSN
jgi:hypothetical protein